MFIFTFYCGFMTEFDSHNARSDADREATIEQALLDAQRRERAEYDADLRREFDLTDRIAEALGREEEADGQ